MTFDTFLSTLSAAKVDTDPYIPFSLDRHYRYARTQKQTPEKVSLLIQYWETGGASGGSCWDDAEAEEYSTDETAPARFAELDKALEAVCPAITHLQYGRLFSQVVHEGSESDYEYYGNYTSYAYQMVTVRDLFDKLAEMGLIAAE